MAEKGVGGDGGIEGEVLMMPSPSSPLGPEEGFSPPHHHPPQTEQSLNEQDLEHASWLESADHSVPIMTHNSGSRQQQSVGEGDLSTDSGGPIPEDSIFDDLPVFADERSKVANEDVKRLEKSIEKSEGALREQRDRLRIMEEHLFNVQQEVQHTNMLVDAKRREQQTEEHLRQLALREQGRFKEEIRHFRGKMEEMQDKLNAVQNEIFKANEGMDQFKLQMNWNQEELEQWALAAKQKEEDNIVLLKYARADDLKIKELTLQLEKVTQAMVESKNQVEIEVTATQAKQMELDRIAEDFKSLHRERQETVRQWQEAIEAMKKRDAEINEIGVKYGDARQLRGERLELLNENRERLQLQEEENTEVEAKSKTVDRTLQKKRLELMATQERLQSFKDELEIVKSELASNAALLNRRRSEISVLTSQLEERRKVLEVERKKFQAVKRKLEVEANATERVEGTVKEAEDHLSSKEYDLQQMLQQLEALKVLMFRATQELSRLRQEESDLIAEIYGAKATAKNLTAKLHHLDSQSTRQQELLYNAEFQIQQMERKVARGLGERSDEEKKILMEQIAKLEKELEVVRDKKKMLTLQLRKLNIESKTAERQREQLEAQVVELGEKILELELENSTSEQKVRQSSKVKEEKMVQNDLLKLEMKRLRDMLTIKKDELFSLENRKQQLIFSMEERKHEIATHRDTQRAHLRVAEDEKRKVVFELNERTHQVDKLKAKFEVISKGGVSKVGEDGKEQSQAYFIIKAAQKREELQREGDNLDQEIQKCEREIRALQNTLNHLVVRNGNLRTSLAKADLTSHEAEELRRLEEQAKLAQDDLFHKKKQLQRLTTDCEEDMMRLEQVQTQCAAFEDQNRHLLNAKSQVEGELNVQKESLQKAQTKLEAARASFQSRADLSEDQKALHLMSSRTQVLQDCTAEILFTLGQLAREFPEVSDMVHSQLKRHRLVVPHNPPLRPSSASLGSESGSSDRSEAVSTRGSRTGSNNRTANQSNKMAVPMTEFPFNVPGS